MRVRVLTGRDVLDEHAAAYDELTAATGTPVTGRRPWLSAVYACWPRQAPLVVAVEDSSGWAAAAPLAVRRTAGLHRVVAPGPGVTDTHHLPARDAAAAAALAEALADSLGGLGPWQLQLDQLPADDPVAGHLQELLPVVRATPGDGAPVLHVGAQREPRHHLSKQARYQARLALRRAEQAGLGPRLHHTTAADEVRAVLPELLHVHRERDLHLGRRSDVDHPAYAAFYQRVVTVHAERGEVDLTTLRLGGELAAYSLNFRDGHALRVWDTRINPAFADRHVGRVTHVDMVQRLLADPTLRVLDWMRGEEDYKRSYSDTVVPARDLWAWSSRRARLPRVAYERAREVKRASPALSRAWRRLRR